MAIQPGFKELLELFNSHKLEHLIIGAYALAYHGAPRYTGDIGLFVKIDSDWEEAIAEKVQGTCGGVPVNFVGRERFIKNKKASGRKKDLADIEALGEKPD